MYKHTQRPCVVKNTYTQPKTIIQKRITPIVRHTFRFPCSRLRLDSYECLHCSYIRLIMCILNSTYTYKLCCSQCVQRVGPSERKAMHRWWRRMHSAKEREFSFSKRGCEFSFCSNIHSSKILSWESVVRLWYIVGTFAYLCLPRRTEERTMREKRTIGATNVYVYWCVYVCTCMHM